MPGVQGPVVACLGEAFPYALDAATSCECGASTGEGEERAVGGGRSLGEEPPEGRYWAGGSGWSRGDEDRDTLVEWVGLGRGERELKMGGIVNGWDKLDAAAGEVGFRVEFPFALDSELATSEETSEGELEGRIKNGVVLHGVGAKLSGEVKEDGQGNRQPRLPVLFSVVLADSPDKSLDHWVLCCGKGRVGIDVEGTDVAEIGFDCLRLDSGSQESDPLHDCWLRCREDGSVAVGEALEDGEIDEAFLPGGVGAAGGGGETVPEVESDQP